jgi:hypothetical protein
MFGGVTISLILPKLILSVTRDGIWTFLFGPATAPRRHSSFNGTRQVRRIQRRNLPEPQTDLLFVTQKHATTG